MEEEARARARGLARRRDARRLRLGARGSRCGSRCARCSASIRTPAGAPPTPRASSSARSSYYGEDYWLQVLRGPRTPYARLIAAPRAARRARLRARSRAGARPGARGEDVLSLLMDRRETRADRHVRDQVMTLLFAGHDTTTATISFLFWELARRGRTGTTSTPALDETLRLYPPAWIGPRRAVAHFELHGHRIPAGRARQLLLVGLAPAARRLGGPARVPARALPARRAREDPARRLRAVRRRLADLPRDALRPARDLDHRGARSASASRSSGCPGTGSRSARRRRSDRAAGCRCGCVRAVITAWFPAQAACNRLRPEPFPTGRRTVAWQRLSASR